MQIDANLSSIVPTLFNSGNNQLSVGNSIDRFQSLSQSDTLNISGLGQLANLQSELSNLSAEESAEVQQFRQEVFSSIRDGTFDAESLSNNAPDSVKNLAQEKGIDLEQALSQMNGKAQEMKNLFASSGYGLNLANLGTEALSQGYPANSQDPVQDMLDILFGGEEEEEENDAAVGAGL